MKNVLIPSAIAASALALAACQSTPIAQSVPAEMQPVLKSQIHAVDNHNTRLGDMYLRPVDTGVQVFGKLTGLTPGSTVAVHIHETGSCENMAKAAGGHFNPANNPHGHPTDSQSHAGDLPNVTADANGVATMNFVKHGISVAANDPNSVYGRAFVVHGGTDDYKSQPSGAAGDRIACGLIEAY